MYRNILQVCNLQLLPKRFYKKTQVRVRFAPSPTGHLHLGGLRTALYNYLFARAHKGSFLLRIEDTDQSRVVPGAVEALHNDLIWAGIIPEEDPIRGGPCGPYVQSRRLDLYQTHVEVLLNNGSAYQCFCSERRLENLRKEAIRSRQIPKYDNRCRHLSKEDIKEKLDRGDQYCIRFKLKPTPEPFKDLVYGNITYDISQNEGDPVIMKSDGYPTYHFANVVDDHFMEITHVMRGVEWQISTPKHLLLYEAFGWTPPHYAHLPLVLNSNGSKLSKRQNDIRIETFRNNGIFPMALINYITLAGGGFTRKPGTTECYSYETLIKQFDISSINTNSTKLAPEKLLELNKLEIKNLLMEDKNDQFLIQRVSRIVKEAFPERIKDGSLQLNPDHVISTLRWAQDRITKLSDLVSADLAFLWVKPPITLNDNELKYIEAIDVLVRTRLANIDRNNFQRESLKTHLREFANNSDVPFPDLMKTLRSLLSGLKDGPSVAEMMEILGRDVTLSRLKRITN